MMTTSLRRTDRALWARLAPAVSLAVLVTVSHATAQGGAGGPGGGGQGGLSPDTPVLAPTQPGVNGPQGPAADAPKPKTPLPPRDTPRAQQPGQEAGGAGPKTPLPSRDTPRAPQPGQNSYAAQNPDWPCVQVKVASLSYGQMWGGPPLEDALKTWRDDKEVADLVSTLAARRTSMEDAKAAIDKFAKRAGDDADAELSKLFAGVFDEINQHRSQIVAGIERYARKQRDLSERIKQRSLKMAETQKDMAAQMSPEGQKEQEALNWDTRIYEERSQALTYVCESPVLLEQRAFDIGREIQSRLSQKSQ
ncbi:hypothetical protein [Hansschlegelia zhihuaiae]|uniref:hypothetical protein n=1 Tax=Hansschlegelia zhihuaiae TaxID=405005 RepID=UPI0013E8E523|nr:hypothetical protein [Hansschlegelia zhihuaiae]